MYTALYLIRWFIPMFHLALHTSTEARSRWLGPLTTFTPFFCFSGPKRALAHFCSSSLRLHPSVPLQCTLPFHRHTPRLSKINPQHTFTRLHQEGLFISDFTNIAHLNIPLATAAPTNHVSILNTSPILFLFKNTIIKFFSGPFPGPQWYPPHCRIPLLTLHTLTFFPSFRAQFSLPSSLYSTS